jgi:DNA processing protein
MFTYYIHIIKKRKVYALFVNTALLSYDKNMRIREDKIYLHSLNLTGDANFQKTSKLFEKLGSFENIWTASYKALLPFYERRENALNKFLKARDEINPDKEWQKLCEKGIDFITIKENKYPEELNETPWPPLGVYIKGKIEKSAPKVAIVGTRRATGYGKDFALKTAEILSKAGAIVISGLALGIDTQAHAGALFGPSPTWAVLGSGLLNIYPKANLSLSEKIIKQGGAIMSEYPPDFLARDWTFPERNRIVAGLSRLTIVIEAPEKSGALITARLALEAGREVAALPGDINRYNCMGSNRLLREGAHPILTPEDALYLIGIEPSPIKTAVDKLDEIEESILQCLGESKNADEIIMETKHSPALVSQKLIELELKNFIKQSAGNWHRLT